MKKKFIGQGKYWENAEGNRIEVLCGGYADHETKRLWDRSGSYGKMDSCLYACFIGKFNYYDTTEVVDWDISDYIPKVIVM